MIDTCTACADPYHMDSFRSVHTTFSSLLSSKNVSAQSFNDCCAHQSRKLPCLLPVVPKGTTAPRPPVPLAIGGLLPLGVVGRIQCGHDTEPQRTHGAGCGTVGHFRLIQEADGLVQRNTAVSRDGRRQLQAACGLESDGGF